MYMYISESTVYTTLISSVCGCQNFGGGGGEETQ